MAYGFSTFDVIRCTSLDVHTETRVMRMRVRQPSESAQKAQ